MKKEIKNKIMLCEYRFLNAHIRWENMAEKPIDCTLDY